MAEPASTTGAGSAALVAVFGSLVGSRYGPLVACAVAGFIGAYISFGEVVTTGGRLGGVRYVLVYTLAATFTAGSISFLIERFTAVPAIEILVLVAVCVGWIGGRWKGFFDAAIGAAQFMLGRRVGERGGKRK